MHFFLTRVKRWYTGHMRLSVSRILIETPVERGTQAGACGICGIHSTDAYHRNEILDKTSANLTAIFELNDEWICAHCAEVWRKPKYWHRAICARPGNVLFPVISTESATDDRPTWSSLIRDLLDDLQTPRVLVLTTDPKKRVWPMAKISQGRLASIYIHDTSRGVSGNYTVSLPDLLDCLDLIEHAYTSGFSKPVIGRSLYDSPATVRELGLTTVNELERAIAHHRSSPHFVPALIMAQKQEATQCLTELNLTDSLPVPQPASPTGKPAQARTGPTTQSCLLGN